MTELEVILSVLLLVAVILGVSVYQRYLALKRKHKALQRLYDKAEQQLSTLWANRKE